MFKSLSFKIALMFVLLTVSVIILIGTFMTSRIDTFYDNEFKNLMSLVFNEDYKKQLNASAEANVNAEEIFKNISVYNGQIGVDSFRNVYLLDGTNGKTINKCTTNTKLAKSLEISPNIISAISGTTGDSIVSGTGYMDYAIPVFVKDSVKYIVYIRDTKEETDDVLSGIFMIMLQGLMIGLIISVLFSILLSKTIILPIQSLTNKASSIAAGDFDQKIETRSSDEIGKLTNTFNIMAEELKNTLNEIQNEKNKSETILLYMTDGVLAFGDNGSIIHINPAAKELLGVSDVSAANFELLFGQTDLSLEQMLYLPQFKSTEKIITTPNGSELNVHFAPFETGGKTGGLIAVIQDITEQQRLDRARKEFIANVSHELRTPLTTVKSYAETLLDSTNDNNIDSGMFASFLNVINSETDRMTRLVKDLLLLSRLDYSLRDMPKEFFDISDMIKDLVFRLSRSAEQKKQNLIYEPTNKLPMYYGSIDRIEQVLINIITNAIKYTPQNGTVLITTMHMYNSISVKVKDNGIGIPEKDLEHIFERFYRVDKARSREMGGTGLGLAIAKEIVEAHDGTINIKSVLGSGTEVTITLPISEGVENAASDEEI